MEYADYLVHYNKNHDKRTGRFTFGDGNGDGVSADDYRTPELDAAYNKYSSILKEAYKVDSYVNDRTESDRSTLEKITNMSAKALKNIGVYTEDEVKDYTFNDYDYDFFEYFYGYRTIAYLATKGYNKEQINDIIVSNDKFSRKNYSFESAYNKVNPEPRVTTGEKFAERYDKVRSISPYPAQSDALLMISTEYPNGYKDDYYKTIENYIDECVKLANNKNEPNFDFSILDKETKHSDMNYSSIDYSEYLMHFNKNHDKKSGRFTYGDGDGDGQVNERTSKNKQSESDGSKKTLIFSSPKNPNNPFSGREKIKIEVSDEAYKEFMKADTKHDIIRGTTSLASGGLFIAAGILTENPVALGIGVAHLVNSAANYVDSGTHFVNKIVDSVYKDKPVGEIESLIKVDPSLFGNKKYYDPKTKEVVELSYKEAYERNKAVGYK